MNNFKLMGFKRGRRVKAIILVTSSGKTFDVPLKRLVNTSIIENLTMEENREIYRKLYSSEEIKTYYELDDRSSKNWLSYMYLSVILTLLYITSNIIGIKPANLSGFVLPSAIFLYPITYIISDIINEFYGLKLARKAINTALFSNLIFCMIIYASTMITPLSEWAISEQYNTIVKDITSVLIASSLAYIISEHTNAYLLYKIKILTNSKNLPIRIFTSSIVSLVIDSSIFISIAFHYLDNEIKLKMILGQVVFKSVYAMLGIFPIYLFRYIFNKYISK